MITRVQAKNFLGIPSATTTYDTIIDDYITLVTAEISAYIGRPILMASYSSEPLELMGSDFDWQPRTGLDTKPPVVRAKVKNYPVNPASAVTITYDGETLVSGTDYLLDDETGIVDFYTGVSDFQNAILASYTAGYSTSPSYTDTPADLRLVAQMGVKAYFTAGGTASEGGANVDSKKIGDFSVKYTQGQSLYNSEALGKAYLTSNSVILSKYMGIDL